jgi:hypothetical protein
VDDGEVAGLLTARDVIASVAAETPDRAAGEAPADSAAGLVGQGTIGGASTTAPADGGGSEAGPPGREQGICEQCGTLTRDLQQVNGAVVCADCRAV